MSELEKKAKTFSQIENQYSPLSERKWVLLEEAKELEKWTDAEHRLNERLLRQIAEANRILDFEITEWEKVASVEADPLQGEAATSLKRVKACFSQEQKEKQP